MPVQRYNRRAGTSGAGLLDPGSLKVKDVQKCLNDRNIKKVQKAVEVEKCTFKAALA